MRIFIACLFLAVTSVVPSQTSQDLHNRYGEPDRERFAVRAGISLTVQYGSDRLVCSALIEPPQPLTHSEEDVPLMFSDGVSEVLEEVAPDAMRGKQIGTGGFVSGCNGARITEYENVSIMRATHTCDRSNPNQDVRTTITFKRDTCPKQKK